MSTVYTPVPVPIDTITLPQDVIDDVIVETVNPPLQNLADAAKLALDIADSYGRTKIKNEDVAPGDLLTFEVPFFDSGGVAVGPSQFQFAAAGTYLITFGVLVTKADATLLQIDLITTPGPVVLLTAQCTPNADGAGWVSACGLIEATADMEVFLRALAAGSDDYTIGDTGQISAHRIR